MSKPFVPLNTLSLLTKVAVVVLAGGLLADKGLGLSSIDNGTYNFWMIPAFWVGMLAPAFYLFALWAASDVFDRMDKGDAFGPAMIKGLKEVGNNMICGAVAAIFIVPTLIFLIDTNFKHIGGFKYHVEIEDLTIGAIGLVLALLARHGQVLKSELDQIV